MHTIHLYSTAYPIPSRWDELTRLQLHWIAWLQRTPRHGVALTKLFFFILTMSLPFWKRIRLQWFYLVQATTAERGDFLILVENFHTHRSFTSQKLPYIRINRLNLGGYSVLLRGPEDRMANSTLWEFIQAEKHYLAHLKSHRTPDIGHPTTPHLDSLIAVLYRQLDPSKSTDTDIDSRIALTDAGTRSRTALISRMPIENKLIVLLYFEGCRNFIIQAFPRIFPKPTEDSPKSPQAKQPKSPTAAWVELITELATDMTAYESIGSTNLYTAMTYITKLFRKNEEALRSASRKSRH